MLTVCNLLVLPTLMFSYKCRLRLVPAFTKKKCCDICHKLESNLVLRIESAHLEPLQLGIFSKLNFWISQRNLNFSLAEVENVIHIIEVKSTIVSSSFSTLDKEQGLIVPKNVARYFLYLKDKTVHLRLESHASVGDNS